MRSSAFIGRTVAVVGLALGLPACSLMGLQNFTIPACVADSDCDALNELEGIDSATATELYQCVEGSDFGGCVFRARDDDEDGEPAIAAGGADCDDQDPTIRPGADVVTTELVGQVPTPRWLRWSSAPAGQLSVAYGLAEVTEGAFDVLDVDVMLGEPSRMSYTSDLEEDPNFRDDVEIDTGCPISAVTFPTASTEAIADPAPAPPLCNSDADCQDELFCNGFEICDPSSSLADSMGCLASSTPTPCSADQACDEGIDGCLITTLGSCTLRQAATAYARDDEWLGAAIHTQGCAAGQLVVGWMSGGEADFATGVPGPNLLLRRGFNRAPGFAGVAIGDFDGGLKCTGGHRPEGSPAGAAGLRVAALPDASPERRRPQGLVAYLGAPLCRGNSECSGGGASGAVRVEVIGAWLEQAQSSNATPVRWVSLSDSGIPQILETPTNGNAPPALAAVDGDSAGYVLAYGAESGGLVARFIPSLADPTEVLMTSPFATPSDSLGSSPNSTIRLTPKLDQLGTEVSLAAGGSATAQVDFVGVAVGEGTASVPMMFVWLEGDALWGALGSLNPSDGSISTEAPVELAASGAAEPEVSYVATGLCGPECAGWAVTWVEGGTARLMRFTEDGTPVDESPVDMGGSATFARAYEVNGSVRVAWHDPTVNALVVSNGQCPPLVD